MAYKMLSLLSQKYVDGILNIINSYNNVHDDKVKFDLTRNVNKYHVQYDLELHGNPKAVSFIMVEINNLTNYDY